MRRVMFIMLLVSESLSFLLSLRPALLLMGCGRCLVGMHGFPRRKYEAAGSWGWG